MTRSKQTNLVHGGTKRSQWNEVSEALFLTQGFVYDTAEAAEQRFIKTGPDEYIYARYGNPTVAMFEERMALLEGAEDGFACASGMAAVNGALTSMLRAGDHVVVSDKDGVHWEPQVQRGFGAVVAQAVRGVL